MPSKLHSGLWVFLALWLHATAAGQAVPSPAMDEILRASESHPALVQTILSNTPWSPEATVFRYRRLCQGIWANPKWDLSEEQAWLAIEKVSQCARGDTGFGEAVSKAMGYYVQDMRDTELEPMTRHLGRVADSMPQLNSTWLKLQAWRVFMLIELMHWEESLPLLMQIEEELAREGSQLTGGLYVHLDCSNAYLGLGIREKAMQHAALAKACFENGAVRDLDPLEFSQITMLRFQLLAAQSEHQEIVEFLDRTMASSPYQGVDQQLKAWCEFRRELARSELEGDREAALEDSYQRVMVLTDPESGSGDEGDEAFRLGAFNSLSNHYIQHGAIEKASGLLEESGVWNTVRALFATHSEGPNGRSSLPKEVSMFLPNLLAIQQDKPIPPELQQWIRKAYNIRLNETKATPLLPLGIGGDGYLDLESLAECSILCILEEDQSTAGMERAFGILLERELTGTLARHLKTEFADLVRIRRDLLNPSNGIYYLQVGWRFCHAFLVDQQGISVHRLGSSRDFHRASERLQKQLYKYQLYGGRLDRLEDAVSEMESFLLPQSIESELAERHWQGLICTGLAGTSYVPFELLKFPSGERLGDLMPVNYLPSLAVGLAIHERRESALLPPSSRFASIIATSAPSRMSEEERDRQLLLGLDLQPLPFTSDDHASLFGAFPDSIPLTVAGNDSATTETLRQLSGADVGSLFILAHGSRSGDLAGSPGLLLRNPEGGTSVIGPTDLEGFHAPALVMLLACSTTDAVARTGDDGAQHLVGALLRQGSDTVLSAHLPLEYGSAKALSSELIQGLVRDGLSPGEALWQARRELGDKAGYPGAYLLHAHGLADQRFYPASPSPGSSSYWTLAWVAALVCGVISVRFFRK